MNQALLSIENEVLNRSDSDLRPSLISPGKSFQEPDWDVESDPVPIEKFRAEDPPALLFFWDGKKVHRITDERLKEEMARMIDYSF